MNVCCLYYCYCVTSHYIILLLIISNCSLVFTNSVDSTLPWPLRLYESSDCVIELVLGHKLISRNESNYMCMLHWYGSDGSHYKVDLRKLIRKERRKVCTSIQIHLKSVHIPMASK